jgi:hypothetical protein
VLGFKYRTDWDRRKAEIGSYWIIEYHIPARTTKEVEYWEAIVRETQVELHLEWCPVCNKTKNFYADGSCYTCGFRYASPEEFDRSIPVSH